MGTENKARGKNKIHNKVIRLQIISLQIWTNVVIKYSFCLQEII